MSEINEYTEVERLNRELAIITRMIVEERKIFFAERQRVKELELELERIQASHLLAQPVSASQPIDQLSDRQRSRTKIFSKLLSRLVRTKINE